MTLSTLKTLIANALTQKSQEQNPQSQGAPTGRMKALALGLLNSRDHTAEINLAAYAGGVGAVIFVLIWWVVVGPRDLALVAAISALLGAVTGGLFKKGSHDPAAPRPGTENKEGEGK